MENIDNINNQSYPPNVQVVDFNSILLKMSKDMNFLSVLLIIYGAFSCLTIIGAVLGIPYIFAGLRMKEAANHFRSFSNNNNISELHYAIERQQRMFFIFKILAIIAIAMIILIIIFYAAIIGFILSGSMPMFENFNDAV